jgi:hypothetical protein
MSGSLSFNSPLNFSLREHSEALIQPKMLKVCVSHQISCPTVRYFMSYNISQTAVTSLLKNNDELDVVRSMYYLFRQKLPAASGVKVLMHFAFHGCDNFSLSEHCETLIQPEVFKVRV